VRLDFPRAPSSIFKDVIALVINRVVVVFSNRRPDGC
jgi:hypothetical protein